jgi:hypothetical protein
VGEWGCGRGSTAPEKDWIQELKHCCVRIPFVISVWLYSLLLQAFYKGDPASRTARIAALKRNKFSIPKPIKTGRKPIE